MTRPFLEQILDARRDAVEAAKHNRGFEILQRESELRGIPRDFAAALREPGISLIAEFKRASPSKGPLHADADPATTAQAYEQGGARALSVLTEPDFFSGSPEDLIAARSATSLPVLWKDFVIDPYQVLQAHAFGADAVLLIARIVEPGMLSELLEAASRWNLTPVVEVFDERDLERALQAGAEVIGINNRDLETFEEDPERTARLRPSVPDTATVAAFSAVSTRAQVGELERIGVDAVLVGEALMRAEDPAAKILELLG